VARVLELEDLLDRERERRGEADEAEHHEDPAEAAVAERPVADRGRGHLGGEELVVGEVVVAQVGVERRRGVVAAAVGRAGSCVLVLGRHTDS